MSCCWYHKGRYFQANHNVEFVCDNWVIVVVDTTKVDIFKQITTRYGLCRDHYSCCWYHKGRYFQANHNYKWTYAKFVIVVVDTTKVDIFKQITTCSWFPSSGVCCCWYHKGRYFQANHNYAANPYKQGKVVVDTTKVDIFKQITTEVDESLRRVKLLLIPQR